MLNCRLFGFSAFRLFGFSAFRLFGFSAFRLFGFSAFRWVPTIQVVENPVIACLVWFKMKVKLVLVALLCLGFAAAPSAGQGGTAEPSVCQVGSENCVNGLCKDSMTLVVDKDTKQATLDTLRYLVWKQEGDAWCLYWVTETYVHYDAKVCGTEKSVRISKKVSESSVKALATGEDGVATTICDDDQEVLTNPDGTHSWKYNGANNFPLVPVPPSPGGSGPVFEPFPFSPESGYNCHGDSFGAGPGGPLEPPTLPVGTDPYPTYGNGGGWIGDPSPLLEPGGPFEGLLGFVWSSDLRGCWW